MLDHPTNSQKTPIAVFIYNRPEHAQSLFQSLSQCDRLAECSLRIFCDGPRKSAGEDAVAAARKVAHEWAGRLGGQVVEREKNLGLARSIVTGVSELCDS